MGVAYDRLVSFRKARDWGAVDQVVFSKWTIAWWKARIVARSSICSFLVSALEGDQPS